MNYQCPGCGSDNCMLIHQDWRTATDTVLCSDCDREFYVDEGTTDVQSQLVTKMPCPKRRKLYG